MDGIEGLIALVLLLFPLFAGIFWFLYKGLKQISNPQSRRHGLRLQNATGQRVRGIYRAARVLPPWLRITALLGVLALGQFSYETATNEGLFSDSIVCSSPDITDGDTFRCDGQRIRLAGIDAPELEGHCRQGRDCTPGDPHAAAEYLYSISRGRVSCRPTDKDVYGRTIARCEANGKDLSCAMINAGHAVRRYGLLLCF